jgi:hypothetical protein
MRFGCDGCQSVRTVGASSINNTRWRAKSRPRNASLQRLQERSAFAARVTSEPVPMATQRMPPVDPPMPQTRGPQVMKMAVFLPQFVREKKCDDEQRNDQKNAQYQLLDHGGLRSQEHDFIVEHPTCRARSRTGGG